MAQTTAGRSARTNYCAFSTDGTTWIDASGFSTKITSAGGERATEGTNSFDGDIPIKGIGPLDLTTVTLTAIYTEGSNDIVQTAKAAHANASPFYLRWVPLGNTSGNIRHSTTSGTVTKRPIAEVDKSSAAVMIVEIEVVCEDIIDDVVP